MDTPLTSSEELAPLYCAQLEEIKARIAFIRDLMAGTPHLGQPIFTHDLAALHLRKILELIAFGALTANKAAYSRAHQAFSTHWNIKRLIEKLRRVHPKFFPRPVFLVRQHPGPPRHHHFDYLQDGFLTCEELVELYDLSSKVIHARNPFSELTTIDLRRPLPEWLGRIETLLTCHEVRPAGTRDVWLVRLTTSPDGRARAALAVPS